MNITLVLDESGSMSGEPIRMLEESCRAIAANLRPGDVISMVTWDTENAVILEGYEVSGPNDPQLMSAIDALEASGGTDLHGGLVAGYDLASQVYDPSRINRIVLISDGGANVGVTDEELITEKAGANDEDGIYMVGVGVGLGTRYNDALMDTVTDIGKGASVFITSEEEAWKVFGEDFVNTLAVSARDVQVQLDMPPGFEIVTFSGAEYSDDPSEVEPQHIPPNDAMVFHQSIATCAPELATPDAEITVTARFKHGVTFEQNGVRDPDLRGLARDGPDPAARGRIGVRLRHGTARIPRPR
jgi:Ca-activated chloride channel homolog